MNETRKQIIELIEPFMVKTLSVGCYILEWNNITQLWDLWYDFWAENEKDFYNLWLQILWHYDITSVLKYIHSTSWLVSSSYSDFIYFSWFRRQDFKIPYKPLHLYDIEEEINLLKLLQQLWKDLN